MERKTKVCKVTEDDDRCAMVTISRGVVFLDVKGSQSVVLPVEEQKENGTAVEVVFKPMEARENDVAAVEDDATLPEEDRSIDVEDSIDAGTIPTSDDDTVVVNQGPRRSERSNKGVPPDLYVASARMASEEPKSRKQALSGPDRTKWQSAMDEEMASLLENNTWGIVPAPKDRKIVKLKVMLERGGLIG